LTQPRRANFQCDSWPRRRPRTIGTNRKNFLTVKARLIVEGFRLATVQVIRSVMRMAFLTRNISCEAQYQRTVFRSIGVPRVRKSISLCSGQPLSLPQQDSLHPNVVFAEIGAECFPTTPAQAGLSYPLNALWTRVVNSASDSIWTPVRVSRFCTGRRRTVQWRPSDDQPLSALTATNSNFLTVCWQRSKSVADLHQENSIPIFPFSRLDSPSAARDSMDSCFAVFVIA